MTKHHRSRVRQALMLSAIAAGASAFATSEDPARCLLVSSQQAGSPWSDGVARAVRSVLDGECELRRYDMDTTGRPDTAQKRRIGSEVKALVDDWQPHVVIAADDDAVHYVLTAHFENADVPFVFNGVDRAADDFAYSNVTGIVEAPPLVRLLAKAASITQGTSATYIEAGAAGAGARIERLEAAAAEVGIGLTVVRAASTDAWLTAFRGAQTRDFVIFGPIDAIDGWDDERVRASVGRHSHRLTVTSNETMRPYAMLGMTPVPEEHGEWSASAALAIITGVPPTEIPIAVARRFEVWANEALLAVAGLDVPDLEQEAGQER